MSITAVPIRPTRRRILVMLWLGVLAALGIAAALAFTGTGAAVAQGGTPEQFLAWNGDRAGVTTTASGLQYQVIEAGEGDRPTTADVVLVDYAGTLRDGTEFDRGERTPFPVEAVVPGFSEALQLMPKGGRYRIWIPPALGYGDRDTGGAIPPDSVLVFDVTMIDFIPAAVLQQMQGMGMMPGGPGGGIPGAPPPR